MLQSPYSGCSGEIKKHETKYCYIVNDDKTPQVTPPPTVTGNVTPPISPPIEKRGTITVYKNVIKMMVVA